QLPERPHEPRADDREPERQRARDRHRAGTPPFHQPADERHEQAVEEEAERHHGREAGAVGAEIRDHRLEERPGREPQPARQEDHDGEGDGDPPPVEEPPAGHGGGHYSRGAPAPTTETRPGPPPAPGPPRRAAPSGAGPPGPGRRRRARPEAAAVPVAGGESTRPRAGGFPSAGGEPARPGGDRAGSAEQLAQPLPEERLREAPE